jgi:peroxiredoxin 2/4
MVSESGSIYVEGSMKYLAALIALLLAVSISGAVGAAPVPTIHPASQVMAGFEVGSPAPPFTLDAVVNQEFKKVSLSDYQGKWVVLFFYPGDFTFVCPTEIKGFSKSLDEFTRADAQVLAVSVDSKYSHLAWLKSGALDKLEYPLLSDFSKQTSRAYGVLDKETSTARRGLFIIDPKGVIQYRVVHSDKVGRSVDETLRVLKALQTEELCPLNWKPGDKTIKN